MSQKSSPLYKYAFSALIFITLFISSYYVYITYYPFTIEKAASTQIILSYVIPLLAAALLTPVIKIILQKPRLVIFILFYYVLFFIWQTVFSFFPIIPFEVSNTPFYESNIPWYVSLYFFLVAFIPPVFCSLLITWFISRFFLKNYNKLSKKK